MAFTVEIDHLVVGPSVVIPANKTTLGPPKLKRNWDVKQGFGLKGAFCVYTGEGLAVFDATFEFWDEAKEPLWDAFANAYLTAPKNGKPAALPIYHPILMKPPFRIKNVQVTDIEGWSLVTPGKWQTRLTFLEYRPSEPFQPKKTEAVPAPEKAPPARPLTEQDRRMQASAQKLAAAAAAGNRGGGG